MWDIGPNLTSVLCYGIAGAVIVLVVYLRYLRYRFQLRCDPVKPAHSADDL